MESSIIKLQTPVRDETCSVCERQCSELWFVDTDTEAFVCDDRCKHDLNLATEVLTYLFSADKRKFNKIECIIKDAVESSFNELPNTNVSTVSHFRTRSHIE